MLNQEQSEAVRKFNFLESMTAFPFAILILVTLLGWLTSGWSALPLLASLTITLVALILVTRAFNRRRLEIIRTAHLSTNPADRPTLQSGIEDASRTMRQLWRDVPAPPLVRFLALGLRFPVRVLIKMFKSLSSSREER